ncbi:hypothetical protein NDU88_003825 [Pleurodeles waltl]|uniref:Uncharacterized protein n=1 Tax=Pleurodeles waltl TaxID=8319 RepID=A0AAV7W5Q2_PLEWA|nr:hypothetical protein NDU88_003825 [Pleurodeles waltl]
MAESNDEVLSRVKQYIVNGWPKERNLNSEVQPYAKVGDQLSIEDGIVLRNDKCVPLCEVWHAARLHSMTNLFRVLPAVAFSRALEREGERLEAAEAGGRNSVGLCSVFN